MVANLTVLMKDKPGTLATLGELLGNAGINIAGGCGMKMNGRGYIHILVENEVGARQILEEGSFEIVDERPVLVMAVEDQPGELGYFARRIADAGVNIELYYMTLSREIVFGVDDLEKAREAL